MIVGMCLGYAVLEMYLLSDKEWKCSSIAGGSTCNVSVAPALRLFHFSTTKDDQCCLF